MHLNPARPCAVRAAAGFTITELMVAMTVTLFVGLAVTSAQVSSLRTNSASINMTQLTQELRSAMQLIARDVRRAGYEDDALSRYLTTQAITSGVTLGTLVNGQADCLRVRYEDLDGNSRNVVYRRRVVGNVGRVSAHFAASATCATALTDAAWVDVSDPLVTQVSTLQFVLNSKLTDIAKNAGTGNVIQVGLDHISIVIGANLAANTSVSRTLVNEVQVRNLNLKI